MERTFKIAVLFLLSAVFLFAHNSFAESASAPAADEKKSAFADLSIKALCDKIKHVLNVFPEVVDFMPELKVKTGTDGNVTDVRYNVSGVFTRIETLDKKTLAGIYDRVNTERVRIQAGRIQKQMDAIRTSRDLRKLPESYNPPDVPKPYTLPPHLPKVPPKQPKVPTPPPTPPVVQRR